MSHQSHHHDTPHGHTAHEHAGHTHGHAHGPVVHAPPADALAAYTRAYEAAVPEPGRSVVRVDLEARQVGWEFTPGRTTSAWGFNGQIPGPTIEARVGDVLEVRLTNRLPEPTTIHWHGLQVPAAMDGTDMVQPPIAPGETFTYRFKLPDAGTFWYHPHSNETVQLERGLYGAVVVRGPDEPQLDAERVLVLDDVQLDRKGQIKPPGWWIEQHNGREGSTRLVNGKKEPELTIAAGQIERWRIVNAASALRAPLDRRAAVHPPRHRRWAARGAGHGGRGAPNTGRPGGSRGGTVRGGGDAACGVAPVQPPQHRPGEGPGAETWSQGSSPR